MKKIIALLLTIAIFSALCACGDKTPKLSELKSRAEEAGYAVQDTFVDSQLEEVEGAFTVEVALNEYVTAYIPIVRCKSENAARKNCELLEATGYKTTIQNGKLFTYPGSDYPEEIIAVAAAIVNNTDIPPKA